MNMMDKISHEARSLNMSHIKNKDTKPEEIVRKYLFSRGFRYRKNVVTLPGKPDIVLPKYKTVIFVNGCFWHVHQNCPDFHWPQTNVAFWEKKLLGNQLRDQINYNKLKDLGWNVLIVWECELKKEKKKETLEKLSRQIEMKEKIHQKA